MDYDKEVVIIPSSYSNYMEFVEMIEVMAKKVIEQVQSTTRLSISFAGSITKDICKIYISYNEAKIALKYEESDNNYKVLWYKKGIETSNLYFYYPVNKEMELQEAIVNGNAKDCKLLLSQLYKMNFVHNNLPYNINIQFLNSVIITLFRVSEKIPEKSNYISVNLQRFADDLFQKVDVLSEFNKIEYFAIELCEKIYESNDRKSTTLINQIVDYIDVNYYNNQISLTGVCTGV